MATKMLPRELALREQNAALKARVRKAKSLLSKALDCLPDYTDGRNDKLADGIEAWLRADAPKEAAR
jgi:hypothetical protein